MATYAAKLRPSAVDGQTIRVLPDGRIRGNAGMEPFSAGTKGGAPSVFYVDGNVVSSGNGLGWLSAFKTLAEGLAAAHTYMSTLGNRAWAQRATVYCCADFFTETITKFAEKTDVIGVGSDSEFAYPRLVGNQVLEPSGTDTYHGYHWHNMEFYGATGITVDIPIGQNGQGFYGCTFTPVNATTIGLSAIQSHNMQIVGCEFRPTAGGIGHSTAAIQINAGSCTHFLLKDSFIYSYGIGLDFNCTAGQPINCVIEGCTLICPGNAKMAIDDESSDLWVINNRWCCELTNVGDSFGLDVKHACGNIATGADHTDAVPDIDNL